MSDLKILIKGKGEEFAKAPEKVLKELGLLKETDDFKPSVEAGGEPNKKKPGVHVHNLLAEVETHI